MNAQMFIAFGAWTRAAAFIQPRLTMHKTQRHKFGEASRALLDCAKQQNVPNPVGGFFNVAIHHGRGGWDSQFVSGGNDFDPARYGKLVRTEFAAHAVVKNFCRGARNASEA